MKKIILLSLITIGIGAASVTAQAGGFPVLAVGPVRLPLPPLPPLPILAPPAVVFGGVYASPVVVGDCYPDFRYRGFVGRDRFDHRFDDHRFDTRRFDNRHEVGRHDAGRRDRR